MAKRRFELEKDRDKESAKGITPWAPKDTGEDNSLMKDKRWMAALIAGAPFLLIVIFLSLYIKDQNQTVKQEIAACRVKYQGVLTWKEGMLKNTASHYFLITKPGSWYALDRVCRGRGSDVCEKRSNNFQKYLRNNLGGVSSVGFCEKHPVQIKAGGEHRWMPNTAEDGLPVKP